MGGRVGVLWHRLDRTTQTLRGGGGGAGDLWWRLVHGLHDAMYVVLGVNNAHARAACGSGVTSSDLSKLASTGWKYQPLVKPGTPAGTACVKRVFDANKYVSLMVLA